MAHSRLTANKQLPQFDPTDKPTWLGDINEAMSKIDAEFGRLQGVINDLQTQLNNKADKVVTP